jgi:dTDP-4-dehydrorhamnose 3,5-epimerase
MGLRQSLRRHEGFDLKELVRSIDNFSGALHFQLRVLEDTRGSFTKIFHSQLFREMGWPVSWREECVSLSHPGVVRGLHFQLPPFDHDKLVVVLAGQVGDAAVDLRKQSATFGQHRLFHVETGQGVWLPRGFAHGFCVRGHQDALLLYLTTTEHAPEHDFGIRWDSLGIDWGVENPVISQRDQDLPRFDGFVSPF